MGASTFTDSLPADQRRNLAASLAGAIGAFARRKRGGIIGVGGKWSTAIIFCRGGSGGGDSGAGGRVQGSRFRELEMADGEASFSSVWFVNVTVKANVTRRRQAGLKSSGFCEGDKFHSKATSYSRTLWLAGDWLFRRREVRIPHTAYRERSHRIAHGDKTRRPAHPRARRAPHFELSNSGSRLAARGSRGGGKLPHAPIAEGRPRRDCIRLILYIFI